MMIKELFDSLFENADQNAFYIQEQFYSYLFLRRRVALIQQQIKAVCAPCSPRNIAVVCTDDVNTYASLLAIWFSGHAYVPLGLHNPVERNLAILGEARAEVIISTRGLIDPRYAPFNIIDPAMTLDEAAEIEFPYDLDESCLAYVLFTSGSTGLPKGVPISHRNISAFVDAFLASPYGIKRGDRSLQMFELTFDVSISSYLIALLKGACVYTVPNQGVKYMHVLKLIGQHELTHVQIVPSTINLAKPLLKRLQFAHVRCCGLVGEATMVDLLPEWRRCIPQAEIYNYYGPTEASIFCSIYQVESDHPKSYNGMLAIGKAMKGMELKVVDDKGDEVGVQVKGELVIGGDQVTSGYLNNPEKNKASFLELFSEDHTNDGTVKRFYRSGDICFVDEVGDVFYCGRLDNQVKVQGFRVELSEIEFHVRSRFNMNNVVILSENKQGAMELILVLEKMETPDLSAVLDHLKDKLPDYMVPARIERMPEFPLNESGKTDRKKIKGILNGAVQ
jgi:D-alanine--poly(phosphoribitol) ligase subunit 1